MQITKMQNLPQNELEQIAKMRRIKKYKNTSKEEVLISLLKLEQTLLNFAIVNLIMQKQKRFKKILIH